MNGIITFGLILFFVISFFIVYEISKDKTDTKRENMKEIRNIRSVQRVARAEGLGLPLFLYKRRECYGHCPIYNAAFYENGVVGYFGEEGTSDIKRIGYYEFKLTDEEFNKVKDMMDKIDIKKLANEYDCQVTRNTSTIVTFYCDDFIKRVNARCNVPKDLDNFVNAIHKLIIKKTEI